MSQNKTRRDSLKQVCVWLNDNEMKLLYDMMNRLRFKSLSETMWFTVIRAYMGIDDYNENESEGD